MPIKAIQYSGENLEEVCTYLDLNRSEYFVNVDKTVHRMILKNSYEMDALFDCKADQVFRVGDWVVTGNDLICMSYEVFSGRLVEALVAESMNPHHLRATEVMTENKGS